jgi:hypothetical protein
VTFCCRHKAGAKPVNFLHPWRYGWMKMRAASQAALDRRERRICFYIGFLGRHRFPLRVACDSDWVCVRTYQWI